jgi:protein-S-isoprenylcysteine O-methyltransferase Ste14
MNYETVFRLSITSLYISLVLTRAYFGRSASLANQTIAQREQWGVLVFREAWLIVAIRIVHALSMAAAVTLYAIHPPWTARFALPLPGWLRWSGVGLGAICIALLIWVHATIGRYWSPRLELSNQHQLITSGPYRWVRHPMYAIYWALMLASSLISANGLVAAPSIVMIALIYERIPKEERMMTIHFGDAYQAYMKRTGRLLPRLPASLR